METRDIDAIRGRIDFWGLLIMSNVLIVGSMLVERETLTWTMISIAAVALLMAVLRHVSRDRGVEPQGARD